MTRPLKPRFDPCGLNTPHPEHAWPEAARHAEDTFNCAGKPTTDHVTRLYRVLVGIEYRWHVVCAKCERITDTPCDRESAEHLARGHEAGARV